MNTHRMKLTERKYLNAYTKAIGESLSDLVDKFDFSEKRKNMEYLTKSSAVYSSNIEGNSIDLNSYMNFELNKVRFKPDKELQEIEDLIKAYEFAQHHNLSEKNLLHTHEILSRTLLIKSKRGAYRTEPVGVFGKSGLTYLAVEPEYVKQHMSLLFSEIATLLSSNLTIEEIFYFASFIHLIFVHIHPFRDGNGRAARLLEKWFLSEKLDADLWKIPSEEYYKNHRQSYYENINLGVNFYELDYDRCLPFLLMLPNCLKI